MLTKKILIVTCLSTTIVLKKYWKVKNKVSNSSGLVTTTVHNMKIAEVENSIPNGSGLVKEAD